MYSTDQVTGNMFEANKILAIIYFKLRAILTSLKFFLFTPTPPPTKNTVQKHFFGFQKNEIWLKYRYLIFKISKR